MQNWQCRVAPSLGGGFAGNPGEVWGVNETCCDEHMYKNSPTVFFGLYSLNDFNVLRNHKGQKAVLFAGSDIRHLKNGYWLDEEGKIKVDPHAFVDWISEYCDAYCENDVEKDMLWTMGIKCKAVIPSFLGKVEDYPVQELRTDKKRYYTSVSGNDFELYGWHELPKLAQENPDTEYHLYGNTVRPPLETSPLWGEELPNIILHGRIPKEHMDNETRTMTGGLRLTKFDGASEILVKSTLWGQKPLSPYISYDWLGDREKLLSVLNKYPWNAKDN